MTPTAGVRTRASLLLSAAALGLLAVSWTASPAPAAAAPTMQPMQELAVILRGQTAMSRPDSRSLVVLGLSACARSPKGAPCSR